jgi:hypothetical protein
MIDGERVVNSSNKMQEQAQESERVKILITAKAQDRKQAETFLKQGAMLGYIDKKSKLFVPRLIDTNGAAISKSRSRDRIQTKEIDESETLRQTKMRLN